MDNNLNNIPRDNQRVELKVLGISYSQIQSGAYALVLAEADGPMRLPVVVGGMEAQAIAIRLEGIIPPRPLTHDLIASLMQAFGLSLIEVFIYKFEEGIFSSELIFMDTNGQEVTLDARTSDAIAIAMRTNAPIFTTRKILDETGFTMETAINHPAEDESSEESPDKNSPADPKSRLSELKEALTKAIENEEYEDASRITAEIKKLEDQK